ncbi:MAG: hypothetical protein CMG78_12130 [Marinobacter sp.]|nr:hypothetical protein [Marinobacter sp.]|tara:strand:- start:2101 stop:2403 length:303 start_codon:yes stop_codon:yes gene_type:complete
MAKRIEHGDGTYDLDLSPEELDFCKNGPPKMVWDEEAAKRVSATTGMPMSEIKRIFDLANCRSFQEVEELTGEKITGPLTDEEVDEHIRKTRSDSPEKTQ